MKRFLAHIMVLSLSLWPAGLILAQGHARHAGGQPRTPAPILKAAVDKQSILIGEPVHLTLEATVEGNDPLSWPALDSLPHFEFVEKHAVDSTASAGERTYRQDLIVTSFDSGTFSIPRLPFVAGNSTFFTDSIPIRIGYTKIDPSKDYHDIKDVVDIPNPFARWFGWIVAAAALLSVAAVVWLAGTKKLLRVLVPWHPEPRLSPYDEAMRQLDELAGKGPAGDGAAKYFYSRLGEILRVYLYRRMGIATLSETSEELIAQIRQLSLPQQQFMDLAEVLRMSDFVKFAKYQPGLADCDSHYRIIRGAIEELNRKADENERIQAAIAGQPTKQ